MGTKSISGASGKHGRVRIYSSTAETIDLEICVTDWNLTEFAEEQETTNSCSGGKREFDYGVTWVEVSLTMDLDLSQHPLDNPPKMIVGTTFCEYMYLYEHKATGVFSTVNEAWQLQNPKVTQCKLSVPAAGKVVYEFSIKCQTYVRPYQTNPSG